MNRFEAVCAGFLGLHAVFPAPAGAVRVVSRPAPGPAGMPAGFSIVAPGSAGGLLKGEAPGLSPSLPALTGPPAAVTLESPGKAVLFAPTAGVAPLARALPFAQIQPPRLAPDTLSGPKGTAVRVRAMTRSVAGLLKGAGRVSEAASSSAYGLGLNLQSLLTGAASSRNEGTDPVPMNGRAPSLKSGLRQSSESQESAKPAATEPPRPGLRARLRADLRDFRKEFFFPRSPKQAAALFKKLFKKFGWKFVAAVITYYLIRDTILYILIPYLVLKGLF